MMDALKQNLLCQILFSCILFLMMNIDASAQKKLIQNKNEIKKVKVVAQNFDAKNGLPITQMNAASKAPNPPKDTIYYPIGLKVPSKAPDFTAKDNYGNDVNLLDYAGSNPVVLVFYQGYWSYPCYTYLKTLQDSFQLIDEKGATIIAVSPEVGTYTAQTTANTNADFPIINDTDLEICKKYKVNYTLDSKSIAHLKTLNVDLNEVNGKTGNQLPVTAVYIINRDGYVVYKYFDVDVTKRPSVWELANKLSDIK
jgi:peroxiredoxin